MPTFERISEVQEAKVLGNWASMWSRLIVIATPHRARVVAALANGSIAGTETFPAEISLEVAGLKLHVTVDGEPGFREFSTGAPREIG